RNLSGARAEHVIQVPGASAAPRGSQERGQSLGLSQPQQAQPGQGAVGSARVSQQRGGQGGEGAVSPTPQERVVLALQQTARKQADVGGEVGDVEIIGGEHLQIGRASCRE